MSQISDITQNQNIMEGPEDGEREADKDERPSFVPGAIKKIKLQNFMCHDSFELELGPRVNFVIGPNGSGKSALLTAIVVVLGGRAMSTSRAKKNSDLVQYGKNFAKVTIEIHNYDRIMDKDKAYKPDDYGKKIIIEKIIPKDSEQSARLVLRSDKDKRVSERKHELDDMLEFFGIQTNNPICILNQEVSKSFLHSKKPEDKFELFWKATCLEQIETDYNEAKELYKEWDECNTGKEHSFRLLDNEHRSCKEKLTFLQNRCKLQDQSKKLNIEHIWALLRDQEEGVKEIDEKLAGKKNDIDKSTVEIDRRKEKIKSADLRKEQFQVKVKSCEEERAKSLKKRDDLTAKERRIFERRSDIRRAIEKEEHRLDRLEKNKESLQKSIKEIESTQSKQREIRDNEKRMKLEIEQLERDEPEYKARVESLRQRSDQLRHSMTDVNMDVNKAFGRVSGIKSDIITSESNLRALLASQGDDLRKFGPHTQRICEEIELAYKERRFKQKPLGPLGRYIKLKTPEVSDALEIHLGNFVRGFVCDNHSDFLVLENIFKKIRANDQGFREPMCFTRQFKQRFNAGQHKAFHEEYKTLIDHIEVSEDAIYNALLDRNSLEQALFVPDYEEAQNMMITPSMIPKNTRMAYTKCRHIMYPRTRDGGFRTIADDRPLNCYFSKCNQQLINQKKQEIERLKQDLRSAEANHEQLTGQAQIQRSEYLATQEEFNKTTVKLREIQDKIFSLKSNAAPEQTGGLSLMDEELEKCMALIHETKKSIESEKMKIADIEVEKVEIKSQKESAVEVCKVKGEELDKVKGDIKNEDELIKRQREEIQQEKILINGAEAEIKDMSKRLDSLHTVIANHATLLAGKERPGTIRPTEIVKSEKRKIEAALNVEIEENQDPEELMATLRKRMEEIEQIGSLRDHNLRNFNLTTSSLKDRDEGFRNLRLGVTGSVSNSFSSMMRAMNMDGVLSIYLDDKTVNGKVVHKAKTLEMSITLSRPTQPEALAMNDENAAGDQPTRRGTRSLPPEPEGSGPSRSKRTRNDGNSPGEKENHGLTNTRSLSGGERSFSTVAFVLALWHHCKSPFKLLDEIDVFMDMVTRRVSYNALIRFAHITESPGQFIYFSPLQLPEMDVSDNQVRVFEMPQIIRRGVQSLPAALEPQ